MPQGPIYQIWKGSHLEKLKDGHTMSKMKMAALFGKFQTEAILNFVLLQVD